MYNTEAIILRLCMRQGKLQTTNKVARRVGGVMAVLVFLAICVTAAIPGTVDNISS